MNQTFDWSLVQSFLAALDQGSLLGAARALNASQPTIGRHIAELESQLGVVLFERTGRGLLPTATALRLAESARAMEMGAHQLARSVSGAEEGVTGTVRITASQPVACVLLPPVLARMRQALPEVQADLLFSCPPYGNLERYSDDEADLSTMRYPRFLQTYRQIIKESVALLRPDRFACFVVGDFRDTKGLQRGFVGDTIAAFRDAGAQLYNEAILVTSAGSLPIRVGKAFEVSRKLGRTHQQVLVFVKGDARRATAACGAVR